MARVASVTAIYWITSSIVHSLAGVFGRLGLRWLCAVTASTGVEGVPGESEILIVEVNLIIRNPDSGLVVHYYVPGSLIFPS